MSGIGFLDLLGVGTIQEAADLWPLDFLPLDLLALERMLNGLQGALTFHDVRPGATGDGVGLTAQVRVETVVPGEPFVFASLPKLAFSLAPTEGAPARLYAKQTATGVEWIIEALPVEVFLPDGFLTPFDPAAFDVTTGALISGQADTYEVRLKAVEPSSIKAYVKLRVSEEFDAILEFATPVSVGPCRFSGIPCVAVHDLGFILTADPSPAIDARAEALEWIRHRLDSPPGGGFITARSVDLLDPASRLFDAAKNANEHRPEEEQVEPVLEDLIFQASALSPMPVHYTAGVRRSLGLTDNPNGIYNLGEKPVIVPLIKETSPGAGGGLYLIVRQLLFRSSAGGTSFDDPQTAFVDLAFSDDPEAEGFSATVEVTDEWTLEAGIHVEPPRHLFSLFNAHVKGTGLRAGMSFKRLLDEDPEEPTDAAEPSSKAFLAVVDLAIVLGAKGLPGAPADPATPAMPTTPDTPATLEAKSGKPTTIVVNDFGWKFGTFSPGNFWQANKAELKVAGAIRLSVDEFGFVTEPDGGRYFSFSGSWPILGTPTAKPDMRADADFSPGIQFYRLRGKVSGRSDARPFLIDGLGLFLQYRSVSIIGSGMLSDRLEGSIRYREAGLAIEFKATIGTTKLVVGGQFLYGRASGSADFKYLLASLQVSPIPIGCLQLVNLRGLFAWNMQPRLGPVEAGNAQPMRLFEWYKANLGGLEIPATRNIAAMGWEPKENAWAFAAGAGITNGGSNSITIDAFFLYISSPAFKGFLAALELYLGGEKPVAYGVVEIEGDHWSVLIGLALRAENVTGHKLRILDDAGSLTGTFYATNQPGTFAIGRLNDVSSWLSLNIGGDLWIFKIRVFLGTCLEIVDVPDGVRVLAFRAELSGGTRRSAIGSIDFQLAMQLIIGVWRSESRVSGFILWLEGGIRINVLWVFRFGASFKVEFAFLGPDPAFRRISCEVHIRTPWWMPDKTFRWNRTLSQPSLERMATASPPLLEAAAHPFAVGDPVPVPVSPLSDDPQATFSIADFEAMADPVVAGQPAAVAIDSCIALHFKAAVDDKLIWGQITPPGASHQSSGEVSTTYELVELGIRRRPLHGLGSSTWTVLLDPAASRTDSLLGMSPADLAPLAKSPLAMRWDADFQRQQTLDPRHLLLNSELPFLFVLANLRNDENLVRNMPGWPCCPLPQKGVRVHVLNFAGQVVGARAPVAQMFSDSQSMLRWLVTPPLIHGAASQPGLPIARFSVAGLAEGAFATIHLDTPATSVGLDLRWKALFLSRAIVVSAFRGLKPVDEITMSLDADAPRLIMLVNMDGITHLTLRITGRAQPERSGAVDFVAARYIAQGELLDHLVHNLKCGAVDPAISGNGSRFAWLPNHEYEVRISTRVGVAHGSAGTLQTEVPQLALFRTKGLPGLNATPRIGQELDPYVESVYPPPGMLLYRREPATLAFNERFDILQGLDRPALAADPPERRQRLDWMLAADLVAGNGGPARVSAAAPDWIVKHRGAGTHDPLIDTTMIWVRNALSIDLLQLRFELLASGSNSCKASAPVPRRMRVLAHEPADGAAASPAVKRWPARTQVRMNLRRADSPFVDRRAFEDADASAFTTAAAWQVADGALTPSQPGPVQLALFGDPTWEHFQAELEIDSVGSRAGLAVAVDAAAALVAWVDGGALHVVSRHGEAEIELGSAALAGEGPRTLAIFAYDDEISARVGTAEVRIPRGQWRQGRLALAAEGAARFTALRVDGLDAYRFEFGVSRYDDFAAHIGSFTGTVTRIESLTPASLGIAELQASHAPFSQWVAALALPLRAVTDRLEIGVHSAGLLLVESPESLGKDVTVRMRQAAIEIPSMVLSDEGGCRLVIVPSIPLAGEIQLEFRVDRSRYRAMVPDGNSNLVQTAMVTLVI